MKCRTTTTVALPLAYIESAMYFTNACVFGRFKIFPRKILLFILGINFCFYFGLYSTNNQVAHIDNKAIVGRVYSQHKQTQIEMVRFLDQQVLNKEILSNGTKSNCSLPSMEEYTHCQIKFEWLKEMWESDSCYLEWGVDGFDCSIYRYLSQVEDWCPKSPQLPPFETPIEETLVTKENFDKLNEIFGDNIHFKWIKERINRFKNKWLAAVKYTKTKLKVEKWKKKKILFHMGLLDDHNGWDIAKNAFKGGPLGELVQWSDLISVAYLLGHEVTFTYSMKHIQDNFLHILTRSGRTFCPLKGKIYDIIYTDIAGVRMFKKIAGHKFETLTCEMRVLDSFGTEPEFLNNAYGKRKGHNIVWGDWEINSLQFNTMFPHTPDNTFMGFVIDDQSHIPENTNTKSNLSVVYGKRDTFWEGKESYLNAIHEVSEIYGTVSRSENGTNIPSYVFNYGVMPGGELQKLLRKAKIFVGLGFPFEGPAPLEAIANGAVFLNPKFASLPDSDDKASTFYKDKPTTRRLSSQHPYAEKYIGPPHVYTIDIDDLESVKKVILKIFNGPQIKPFIPFEFTFNGMMERVGLQIEKQEFCNNEFTPPWPPLSALKVVTTSKTTTCNEECSARGLICEPSFYRFINQPSTFEKLGVTCKEFFTPDHYDEEIDYPGYLDGLCYLQSNKKLFSCAGRYTEIHQLCPCRDHIKGQVALCVDCLT